MRTSSILPDLTVTRLCMGLLTMSPLQAGVSREHYMPVLERALQRGINFFDTAELYGANHIAADLLALDPNVILSSKSYAETRDKAKRALGDLLDTVKRGYVDIFLMHDRRSLQSITGHMPALEYYIQAREEGLIRHLGISTHCIAGVNATLQFPLLEVIHPMLNFAGYGIRDGTLEQMETALRRARQMGKGVFAMKTFGGGTLLGERQRALTYMRDCDCIDSVAIGMNSVAEVDYNCDFLLTENIQHDLPPVRDKSLNVADWCIGCSRCLAACPAGALSMNGDRPVIDHDKCLLCGYCGTVCPKGALRIY